MEALELNIVKEQVARYCSFSLGKERIRSLVPRFDELWVRRELTRTKEAFDLVVRYGNLPFGGIHDTGKSVEASMKGMTLTCHELRDIADGIRACEHIDKYMKTSEMETPSIRELTDALADHRKIAARIENCITVNYEVLDHASDALSHIRKSIHGCEGEISKEVQRFISRNASKLMDTITTTRNGRTCVLVKISEKNSIDGFIHGESASGQAAYIEPQSLLILNNKLASLKSKEQEEIHRILTALSKEVASAGYELLGNLDTFALLDAIFAKALWAKHYDGCIAQIDDRDEHLYFKAARHPLIDASKVVSNTYEIKRPYHSLLITGSNTGGKTVTLKTIGLFVAMTMCGMAISAEEGIVPLFDALFVDIGDDQSIQESLSTFSSHLSKQAYICDHVTEKSLVLLDELGSGTDPKEGEPLAVSILDELRCYGAMIIATTHYSALKTYGANHEDILLSSVEFDMEKMQPTYRYIEGISGQSNAFEIARRYGLKESIITQARKRKEANRSDSEVAMEKLEQAAMENHELKEKLALRLKEVQELQEALKKEKKQLEDKKEEILRKVREDEAKKLEETQEEALKILERIKALKEDVKPHEITELATQMKLVTQQEDEVEEDQKDEHFELGDYVKMKKLNYYGEIISINKNKVCVLANGMKMNTTVKDITHAQRQENKKRKHSGYSSSKVSSFSMECNVIGMRVAEALAVIDKYLDNAILAKVYQVRLIHGMGTGKLRKGVHDYLKHNANVESFTMGGQGEGGLGATIVTLKQKGKK